MWSVFICGYWATLTGIERFSLPFPPIHRILGFNGFDPGKEPIRALAKIINYALITNLFFLGCEVFVVFYSGIPEHLDHFKYLYTGLDGHNLLVPWMWTALGLMLMALFLFIIPATRRHETSLAVACVVVFIGIWIDKGLGLITGGFVPTPMHRVVDYVPTLAELIIAVGIYAIGFFIVTILIKITIAVKQEAA